MGFDVAEAVDAGREYYEAFWCILARRLSRVKLEADFASEALTSVPRVLRNPESGTGQLIAGDRLLAADGRPLDSLWPLMLVLLAKQPGDPLTLSVERVGNTINQTVNLLGNDDPNLIPLAGIPTPQRRTVSPTDLSPEPDLHDLPLDE